MNQKAEIFAGYLLLAAALFFVLWGFHHELRDMEIQFSDVAFHLSILKALDQSVRGGQGALDFWYDTVPYGFALFRSYQYLPYLFMYGFYRMSGEYFSLLQILLGSTVILSVLLPLSVFVAMRMVGTGSLEGGIAALLSILVSDGNEYGMGLQNFTFGTVGLTTQLWAMVFLPLGVAASYGYLCHGKRLWLALLLFFLTFGCHVIAAVIIGICSGVFAVGTWLHKKDMDSLSRIALFFALAVVVTAHQWWFILSDAHYINPSALEPRWKYEGRGVIAILDLLWRGELFDANRFPILTALLLVAFCYFATHYRNLKKRSGGEFLFYVPILLLLFLSLCMGREIWGSFFDLVSVLRNLHVHRFAVAVHFFGILIIAVGTGALLRFLSKTLPRLFLSVFFLLLFLRPALLERAKMFSETAARHRTIAQEVEKDKDLPRLVDALAKLPYSRVYIGSKASWQSQLLTGGIIPLDLMITMRGIPSVGGILFHAFSLAGETIFDFDPSNVSHFDLFGINEVVSSASWQGAPEFELTDTFGRYRLWSRKHRVLLFAADDSFLESENFFGQTDKMRSFVQQYHRPPQESDAIGMLTEQRFDTPWQITATAEMKNSGKIIAPIGFHPNWKAAVDGSTVDTQWVTPGFVAIKVPPGRHEISISYQGSWLKKYLLFLSTVIIIISSRFHLLDKNGRGAIP